MFGFQGIEHSSPKKLIWSLGVSLEPEAASLELEPGALAWSLELER